MKAFPTHREEGMELRDYFAAKAMQALMPLKTPFLQRVPPSALVKQAYKCLLTP
jgi:hypothetical protein